MTARRIVLAASLLLNLVLVYTLIWGDNGAISYKELRFRCDALEERISRIADSNLAVSKEIRLLQSDEKYIEKMIRNRLNFVRKDEILYLFPGQEETEAQGVLSHDAEN